ncbi:MAG: 3-deoxy-D-manno-octulosonic acid transferase [Bacteroidetes bacterium]|nr:3-deoxy-D-manno-octulosonic acid transferase [Bacteroidota bacterium]
MGKFFYQIFLRLYPLIASIISPFNPKAKKWIEGRKDIFIKIKNALQHDPGKKIWMHCSSLGEFEQGRPLLESLSKVYPDLKIVVSFFSPSGYEVQKNYAGANYVFYLPMDSKQHAQEWYDLINPSLVLFVKYEFWNYYLQESKKRNIPLLLISGIFRKSQPFFSWYGRFYREMLTCFTHFFIQDKNSAMLLQSIGLENFTICGDTRFDRVIQMKKNTVSLPGIEIFCEKAITLVAGSTWLEDDEELNHYINKKPEMRFIIAPHDVGEDRIKECLLLYKNSILYSEFVQNFYLPPDKNTLIIDNIGMLKRLYGYATISFVGGGFGGDGVHNVLEPAVYGRPVLFGPVYEKFPEATGLVETGAAFSIIDAIELEEQLNELLEDDALYQSACTQASAFVLSQAGATNHILGYLKENLRLMS